VASYEDIEVDGRPMKRCPTHDHVFGKTKTCADCDIDPGIAPADEIDKLPPPPAGCLSSLEHERCLVTAICDIDDLIERVMPPFETPEFRVTDYHLINSLAKLHDVRCKLRRAAAELAGAREDDELVALRDRRMNGGARGKDASH
jgi:hypothetical protein